MAPKKGLLGVLAIPEDSKATSKEASEEEAETEAVSHSEEKREAMQAFIDAVKAGSVEEACTAHDLLLMLHEGDDEEEEAPESGDY
jgi:hypothetical protein